MQKPFHHLARGIFIKDNKILLAQARGYTNTFLPGGHIEFGESAKDALIREIQEELGIRCTVNKFLGLVEHKWEKNGELHCEINQVFEVNGNELPNNLKSSESHLKFFWCDEKDLDDRNLQPYPFRKLIKGYLNGRKDVWWESSLNSEIDDSNRN
ncbi:MULTISPECIES: NUDIX domain-containing protein [unclassified Bacillus (in: firmicutes)]|uniref:NUDIX domain-containing protein n=1 Tax=unclassified Bacillus (in: firmicutes) TaxID=185979 RepID=UPI0008E38620|nr:MULTISPECIES: NUDIX domain-containing protein [unclassified Bacillus (in: firmicutes)]SFH96628.1 NUDIX domain-containing protein [Bacillus sp. 71mf]SFS94619.1 NUDIX domain-containing protein [Bacillus sp. 103mf]